MPHSTSDSFASDRGTANFNVLTISRARRRKASYSVRHVAWADNSVLNGSGKTEAERQYTAYVPSEAELDNLDLCLGRSGTLSCGETAGSAYLAEYDAGEWVYGGEQLVKLLFILGTV